MRLGLILIYTVWNISMSFAQMAPREYFKFAKFNYENDEHKVALNMLNKAINYDPQYVNAYYLRAEVNYFLGNYQGALQDIDHVLSLDSQENAYYADYLLLRGKLHEKLNRKDLAIIDLNKSILISGTKAESYFERACIKKERNFTGSVSDMNNAIRISPDNSEYYAVRAQIKRDFYHPNYENTKYESILKDIEQAIALSPDHFKYYKFRANLYIQSGHKNRALKDLNDMIVMFPDQPFGYAERGLIRMQDALYKYAIADYNQAIALAPNNEKNYRYRGLCNHNTGFYHEARKDFTKAIEILSENIYQQNNPDPRIKITLAEVYILRGICLHQMGNGSLSCGDFLQANDLGIGKGLFYYKKFCERY